MSDVTTPRPSAEHVITTEAATEPRSVGVRSGVVTGLAVANFVLGALQILYGLYLLLGAKLLGSVGHLPGAPVEFQRAAGLLAGVALALAVLALLMGLLMAIAGWGLLGRRPWSRILTLVLGGLAVLAALASLSPINPVSLLLNAGYAALAFVVLLNPRFAREFVPGWADAKETQPGAVFGREVRGLRLKGSIVLLALGALCLGFGLGWGFSRLGGNLTSRPKPLVLVLANNDWSSANNLTRALTQSAKVRVLETSLFSVKTSTERHDFLWHLRKLNVDLTVVVDRYNGNLSLKVVEVKTGVLLDDRLFKHLDDEKFISFVESAAKKWER